MREVVSIAERIQVLRNEIINLMSAEFNQDTIKLL